MTRHFLDIKDARVLKTRQLLRTRDAVSDAFKFRGMIVIHGPAGLGKSFAIAEATAALSIPPIRVVVQSRPTERFVVAKLLEAITGVESRGSRYRIQHQLLLRLAEQPRLVVVEEAQNLNRVSFEDLRHLHDDDETKFGLVFDGGHGAWEVIDREPMLKSRLSQAVRFKPLSQEDILDLIPTYHPIFAGVHPDLVRKVDDELARGVMRSWALFTHTALRLCARTRKETIDDAVVRQTMLQLADLI